jgi:hypothetical protein
MKPARLLRTSLAAAAVLAAFGCDMTDSKDRAALPDKGFVFAITTSEDFKTGSFAAYGLESRATLTNLEANHPDAVVRYRGGSDIFVINRLGRDNLLVVDRNNLKVVLPIKFPALSNPQDVEARDGLIYASFLAYDSVLIYDQKEGGRAGAIDIGAYADSDGHAEAAALRFAGDYLYLVAQNLDTRTVPFWTPYPGPKLLKIDVKKREVAEAFTLPLANPQGIAYDSAKGMLYIPCLGGYLNEDFSPKLDGGIVAFDPAKGEASVLKTEAELGGNVGDARFADGKLFFDLATASADRIVALDVADKSVATITELKPYQGGGLAVDAETHTLCIGDRTKGLRLFALDTFKEKDSAAIDLGLLPADLAVIR